jgi:hypothetical protein
VYASLATKIMEKIQYVQFVMGNVAAAQV